MKRRGSFSVVLAGLVFVLGLVVFVSPNVSESPDGLERVALDNGLDDLERDHPLSDGPLADYNVRSVEDRDLSRALAGVAGVVMTFGVVAGLLWLARRYGGRERAP